MLARLQKITGALLTPLFYLDLTVISLGALWMVSAQHWQAIGTAVTLMVVSPFLFPVLLMPAGIASHFMGRAAAAGKKHAERGWTILSLGWILFFLSAWTGGVVVLLAPPELWPANAFAAAVALACLLWWASHDRGNVLIVLLVEAAHVVMLGVAALRLTGRVDGAWPTIGAVFFGMAAVTLAEFGAERLWLKRKAGGAA